MQVSQVAVVLEAFLELVGRQQVIQVSGLRTVGQFLEAPVPACAVDRIARQEHVEYLARLDETDRAIDAIGLFVKGFDSIQVMVGGLTDRIDLRQRIGNREHGLLHRRVEQIATPQFHPRHERAPVVLDLGIRPANTE